MKRIPILLFIALLTLGGVVALQAAVVVPNEVQMPGSQPGTVNVESPTKCDNCHGG